MMRVLIAFFPPFRALALLSLLAGGSALAQPSPGPGCPLTGCTFSGPVNTTSASGYQINGLNAISVTAASTEKSVFVGPYTGASSVNATSYFTIGMGWAVFESLNTSGAVESVGMGSGAAIAQTTGGGSVAIGTSACAGQIGGGCTAIGSDAMRDTWTPTGNQDVAIGPGALADGSDGGDNIAIGVGPLSGAASTITIGGTITVGDVLTFTPSTANACNGTTITVNCTSGTFPATTYTVVSGDTTLALLAAHINSALNSAYASSATVNYILGDGVVEQAHNLFSLQFQIPDAMNYPTVLKGHYPGSWQVTFAYSCTGTCGETAAIGTGFSGSKNIAIGTNVLGGPNVGNSSQNVVIGDYSITNQSGSVSYSAIVGVGAASKLASSFVTILGYNSGQALGTNGAESTFVGAYAGLSVTGYGNTIVGSETGSGSGCITSGGRNLELGIAACVASPTASYQLSIQDAIYGNNNSGQGGTVSSGCIGFYTTGCTGASVLVATDLLTGNATALATGATAGFIGFPTAAGASTGTPTFAGAGQANCVVDTTNGYLNCYYSGAWHKIAFAAGAG